MSCGFGDRSVVTAIGRIIHFNDSSGGKNRYAADKFCSEVNKSHWVVKI